MREYRTLMLVAAVLAAFVSVPADAQEQVSAKVDWVRSADAPGYAKATVWQPAFADKGVWPLTGKERFLKQSWPEGRLLIWAHPGQSADVKSRSAKLDCYDLKNWIDAATSKSATKLPDENTDIYLPASETPYTVSWKKAEVEHFPVTVRHVTVERGARWYSSGLKAYGSIWIKRGASMGNHGSLALMGDRDTFFRNDNGDPSTPSRSQGSGVSQYITFDKPNASAEFLGTFSTGDEFRVFNGTLIIGPDSRVQPGRNATPFVQKEATLVLLDGAAFGKWVNQIAVIDLNLMGTLQGGLPERPLTRDAHMGVSYQNTNGTKFYDNGLLSEPRGRSLESRMAPLIFHEGSRVKTYSIDIKRASLVVGWVGLDARDWHANPNDIGFKRMEPEAQNYLSQQLGRLPRGITAAFARDVQIDGVRFDHFLEEGLLMLDPSAREGWKNVFYGPDNKAPAERLYRKVASINFRGGTYEF